MRHIDVPQGSAAWLDARCGKITASRIADVLDTLKKGGEGAGRRNYRIELVAERLAGRAEDHYVSADMERGTYLESQARTAYEIERNVMVETAGLILHPTYDYTAGSPDGLIGDDGGLEIKVPRMTTHIKWMLEDVVPEEHQAQCLWNMKCAERSWWDFESYCPELPGLETFVVRMPRDEQRINEIEYAVAKFNEEVDAVIESLKPRMKAPARPVDGPNEYDKWMAMIHPGQMDEVVP